MGGLVIPQALQFADALSMLLAGLGVGLVVGVLGALTNIRR